MPTRNRERRRKSSYLSIEEGENKKKKIGKKAHTYCLIIVISTTEAGTIQPKRTENQQRQQEKRKENKNKRKKSETKENRR